MVVNADSTSVFVRSKDFDSIYILSYGVTESTEIAYEATFEMFVQSFKFDEELEPAKE